MKRDLRNLFIDLGRRVKREPHRLVQDYDRISLALSKRHINLSGRSLHKLWELATGRRKLSPEALNRLALFAGFQDWHDFSSALHGEADASVNYEEEPEQR